MNRWCPNCGRTMEEFELGFGPGGLGCIYCTAACPNCGREIFDTDIIYGDPKTCCKYCHAEAEEEQRRATRLPQDDLSDTGLDDGLDSEAAESDGDSGGDLDDSDDDLSDLDDNPADDSDLDQEMLEKLRRMSREELDAFGEDLRDQIQNLYDGIMDKMKNN